MDLRFGEETLGDIWAQKRNREALVLQCSCFVDRLIRVQGRLNWNDERGLCHAILQCSFNELDLPSTMNKWSIKEFCFKVASLIFCTASSSYKLHSVAMDPLNILVIDEAAQLKECESTIPLQLPGLRHAVLVGDEYQ